MVSQIDLEALPEQSQTRLWLEMIDDGLGQPICIPGIILKGKTTQPILGLVAAIHGNELNDIPAILTVMSSLFFCASRIRERPASQRR